MISYDDNINAGSAAITVTGKGNYSGTATGAPAASLVFVVIAVSIFHPLVNERGDAKAASPLSFRNRRGII